MVVAGQCGEEVTEGDEGVGAHSVPAETFSRQAGTGLTPHTCHYDNIIIRIIIRII